LPFVGVREVTTPRDGDTLAAVLLLVVGSPYGVAIDIVVDTALVCRVHCLESFRGDSNESWGLSILELVIGLGEFIPSDGVV
jgi:hypothetical protein